MQLNQEVLAKIKEALPGKSMLSTNVVLDGCHVRIVERYNSRHVMCADTQLSPARLQFARAPDERIHMKLFQLTDDPASSVNGEISMAVPAESDASWSQGGGTCLRPSWSQGGRPVSLLPIRLSIELLSRNDFNKEFFWGTQRHTLTVSTLADIGLLPQGVKNSWRANENQERFMRAKTRLKSMRLRMDEEKGVTEDILTPTLFLKWGRNGRPKQRWVVYDSESDTMVWKANQHDKRYIGSIPFTTIKDVVTGVQTPVLLLVRDHRLRPDLVFSIVSAERTLDLQAESTARQQRWVAGLKAQFEKQYVKVYSKREVSMEVPRCTKAYPPNFRCKSDALLRSEDLCL